MTDEPKLPLFSDCLLSKWGFGDGDEPDAFWDWREEHGEPDVDWHATLRQLVREHLVPKLDQRVELIDVETTHNPIRANAVDGVEVDWYADSPIKLTPERVDIPYSEVLRIAREVELADA